MNEQLRKITESLNELERCGYFKFYITSKEHLRKEDLRIKIDKYNFKVSLTISDSDTLEEIATNIAMCYKETKEMEKLYLHKIKSPDLFEALEAWSIARK